MIAIVFITLLVSAQASTSVNIPSHFVGPEARPKYPFVAPSAQVYGQPALAFSTFPIKTHNQNPDGSYNFVYAGGPSSRAEVRDPSGAVRGSFNYVDAFGRVQTHTYVADNNGFRTVGSDVPKPEFTIQETPEVQDARKRFEDTFKKALTGNGMYPEGEYPHANTRTARLDFKPYHNFYSSITGNNAKKARTFNYFESSESH